MGPYSKEKDSPSPPTFEEPAETENVQLHVQAHAHAPNKSTWSPVRLISSNISKYPSGREQPFKNAVNWLHDRRLDDALGRFWRVHDHVYDLEPFITLHPGGSDWIKMTRGMDITEAFEASHVVNFSNVQRILAKYRVTGSGARAVAPRNRVYTFDKTGFYNVLKRRVEPILKEVGTGPTTAMVQIQDGLAGIFLILAMVSVWSDSTALQVLTGLELGATIICAHNFFHIRDNWRKYYFDLSCLSSFEWRISHALSHHLYTNTVLDYEIYMLEPFFQVCPGPKSWTQKFLVHPFLYLSYFANFWLELTKRILNFVRRDQLVRPENFIVMAQLLVCIWLAPSILLGIKSWVVIHSVASFYFGFVGLMAAHHHPSAFHEGDEARPNPDFGLCQLDATKARAESFAQNLLFIVCTFGQHPLHHLFPTVCHSKLHHLSATLEKTLTDHDERFPPLDKAQFLIGIHLQILRETPVPAKAKRS